MEIQLTIKDKKSAEYEISKVVSLFMSKPEFRR